MWSSLKVTPLLRFTLAESPVLWYGGRTDLGVLCLIANVAVSKSRHRLFFYPKRKVKKHMKDPWDYFLSSGGRLWKGKVLAPFSSIVIYGLLVAFYITFFVWQCALWWFLKVFLKRRLRLGELCNDSRFGENVYKVLDFWKYFMFWKCLVCICFEIVWCVFVLKVSKQLRTFLPTQKSFVHFSPFLWYCYLTVDW